MTNLANNINVERFAELWQSGAKIRDIAAELGVPAPIVGQLRLAALMLGDQRFQPRIDTSRRRPRTLSKLDPATLPAVRQQFVAFLAENGADLPDLQAVVEAVADAGSTEEAEQLVARMLCVRPAFAKRLVRVIQARIVTPATFDRGRIPRPRLRELAEMAELFLSKQLATNGAEKAPVAIKDIALLLGVFGPRLTSVMNRD